LLVVAGLIASASLLRSPMLAEAQSKAPAVPDTHLVTVPEGTRIALALTSPIGTRISKPGDIVRTVVTFPVAVGNVVAVPAGTFVEGVIDKVMRPRSLNKPAFQIHFTRMIFPNGYTVPISRASAQPAGG